LELKNCSIHPAALLSAAAFLRGLPYLRELNIMWGQHVIGLAQGQIRVTTATLLSSSAPTNEVLQVAETMPQLQHLTVYGEGSLDISGLQRVVKSCVQLTSLELRNTVDQLGLDVLLTHATHLKSVNIHELELTESRASAPCTWTKFQWCWSDDLRPFAYLPLHSVQKLTIHGSGSDNGDNIFPGSDWLLLPLPISEDGADDEHAAALVQQAVANLLRCPAFKAALPLTEFHLDTPEVGDWRSQPS
jgi:hypothetical protein